MPGRIRGRLEDGNWVSIMDTEDGSCWCVPIMGPGAYRVREESDLPLRDTSTQNKGQRGTAQKNELIFVEVPLFSPLKTTS